MVVLFVSILCCVMQAAESSSDELPFSLLCCLTLEVEYPDEGAPPPSMQSARRLGFSREQWRQKIEHCLARKNHVRVFYFSKEGERYSATYYIGEEKTGGRYCSEDRCGKAIVPLLYFLKQEYLKGYTLKQDCPEPSITDADFFVQDATLKDYSYQKFFSQALDSFVEEICPILARKGQSLFHSDGAALTADMLEEVLPKSKEKRFCWRVVSDDKAVALLKNYKKEEDIFLIIGGVGILWGRCRCCLRYDVEKVGSRSLFSFKVRGAIDDICAKYPFSKESLREALWQSS